MLEIELFLHLAVCKQRKTVLMLNWIVWNRTVSMYKIDLVLKKTTMVDVSYNQSKQKLNSILISVQMNYHSQIKLRLKNKIENDLLCNV